MKKPPGEKYLPTMIRLPPDLRIRLDVYCAKEERPLSWVLRKALVDWLDKAEAKDRSEAAS